jgi:hypothetical protein
MVKKRGQAAMEFLMTYGWALLVVLVAIGALASFGVLNPSGLLPETCTMIPGIACTDFAVTTSSIDIVLTNGMGTKLEGVTFEVGDENGNLCTTLTGADNILSDGETDKFSNSTNNCATAGADEGSRAKYILKLAYTPSGGLSHNKEGQLITQIS